MAGEYNGSAFRTQGLRGMIQGGARADYWAPLTSQLMGGPPAGNPHADNFKPGTFTNPPLGGNQGTSNYNPAGYSAPSKAAYRSATG